MLSKDKKVILFKSKGVCR